MVNQKEIVITLKGQSCPSCHTSAVEAIGRLPRVRSVKQQGQKLTLTLEEPGHTLKEIRSVVQRIEPALTVVKEAEEQEEEHSSLRDPVELAAAAALTGIAYLLPAEIRETVWVLAYLVVGYPIIWAALRGVRRGNVFNENTLMSIATFGALILHNHLEAIAVMFFYRIGEFIEHLAVQRSQRSIAALSELWPETANLLKDGKIQEVKPEQLQVGDLIIIKPGERVPTDALILEGHSTVNTAALTGESLPRDVAPKDTLLSGTVNLTAALKAQVVRPMHQSAAAKIAALVEEARQQKAPTEKFITRFARYYTPTVVALAALLGTVPPLLGFGTFDQWVYRSLVFLVISCPCALVLSIPLSFFAGIGKAASKGILVRGGNYLEALAKLDTVVFDKTGTLTTGQFQVAGIQPANGFTPEDVLRYAAMAESFSNHPIAQSVLAAAAQEEQLLDEAIDHEEISGMGIRALRGSEEILVGNLKLMERHGIPVETSAENTAIYVAVNGQYVGWLGVVDTIKEDAKAAVAALRKAGVRRVYMLTGDAFLAGRRVAEALGLDGFYAELLPEDKVKHLKEILATSQGTTAFVGDGINDAPVLAQADVGIAMGQGGADAAVNTADVVLLQDRPSQLVDAVHTAQRTRRIALENITLALGIKILVLILGAFGLSTLWEAIFADVGVTVLAVLNTLRISRYASSS